MTPATLLISLAVFIKLTCNFPSLSIVAVHGLRGDWQKTWEADGKVWLRDFIQDDIKEIQVLTFGYNAMLDASGWTHELEDFALQLLNRLKNNRTTEQASRHNTNWSLTTNTL
jgi:cytochrome c biogenesis protein ResB